LCSLRILPAIFSDHLSHPSANSAGDDIIDMIGRHRFQGGGSTGGEEHPTPSQEPETEISLGVLILVPNKCSDHAASAFVKIDGLEGHSLSLEDTPALHPVTLVEALT